MDAIATKNRWGRQRQLSIKLGSHCRSDQLDRPRPINFSPVGLALVS